MTTVPPGCAVCGIEPLRLADPMVPSVPLGRVRICRRCRRIVCRRHAKRVGKNAYECTECRGSTARV